MNDMNDMNEESWKIDAFVDGELDLAEQLAMEQRLEHDEALRQRVESLRSLSAVVREKADRQAAPAELRDRMSALLGATRPDGSPPTRSAGSPAPRAARRAASPASDAARALAGWFGGLGWRPMVAAMAGTAMIAVALNVFLLRASAQDRLMEQAVASHVLSTVGPHLVDVLASDRHTVKPFLSSKLGFSPPVDELPLPGSVLVGGRVDYLDGRPVAALVYRQGEHVVNSFVWPAAGADSSPEFATDRGYRVAHWSQGGMRHCVISDVNREEFQRLVDAVRQVSAG